MAKRSNSNKCVSPNSTNGSSYSTGRNPGGLVPGMAKGLTYGQGEKLKQQANVKPLGFESLISTNDIFSLLGFAGEKVFSYKDLPKENISLVSKIQEEEIRSEIKSALIKCGYYKRLIKAQLYE